jgi:hypothetical protein
LSPNRKVKTPTAFGVAVPANPYTRSARRRGHRRVWPNRKVKTESPLRSASRRGAQFMAGYLFGASL